LTHEVALSTKEAGQLFVHAQYRIIAKKWILLKLMQAVDQKPGYNLEWPNSEWLLTQSFGTYL